MLQGQASRRKRALLAMFTLLIFGLVIHIWEFYFSPSNHSLFQ
jgi:hypothetical protein